MQQYGNGSATNVVAVVRGSASSQQREAMVLASRYPIVIAAPPTGVESSFDVDTATVEAAAAYERGHVGGAFVVGAVCGLGLSSWCALTRLRPCWIVEPRPGTLFCIWCCTVAFEGHCFCLWWWISRWVYHRCPCCGGLPGPRWCRGV